jgi:predicted MFS family arabinose efflux permease
MAGPRARPLPGARWRRQQPAVEPAPDLPAGSRRTPAPGRGEGRSRSLGAGYWRIWTASTISNLGDGVRLVAMPLLAARLTRDPRLISLVSVAGSLPWLVVGLLSGALVDRWDRRRIMWTVDAVRAVVMGALTTAVVLGWPSITLLAVVAFLLATAETLFDNAAMAIVPDLVGHDDLERANARLYAGQIITGQLLGLPLGGVLLATATFAPFALDMTSFAAAALLVLGVSGRYQVAAADQTQRPNLWAEIAEGLAWLWHHRLLRTLCVLIGAANLVFSGMMAVAVLYALEVLGLTETGYGVLLAAFAAGSLAATAVASRLARFLGCGRALWCSIAGSVAAFAGLGGTSSPLTAGGWLAVFGVAIVVWNVITISLRQAIVPAGLLGRVTSAYRLVAMGVAPIGAGLGGLVAKAFGLRAPFLLGAAGLLLAGLATLPTVSNRAIQAARTSPH